MKFFNLICVLLVGMLVTACIDEIQSPEYGKGEGSLILSEMKVETVVGDVITRASLDESVLPSVSDFTIEIVNSEGNTVKTLQPGTLKCKLDAGNYTVKAMYGDADAMSYIPAFYGEKEVTIVANQETEARIETSLVQAVMLPVIDENLLAQFKEYKLELTNDNQTVLLENNKDFFIPCDGNYRLTLSGLNQLGEEFTHVWTYEDKFAIKTRYIVVCNPDLPSFTLPEQKETDAWGTFIYITPMTAENMTSHHEDMTDKVLSNIIYEASSDGVNWIPSEVTSDGKIVIKKLTPSTSYTIRSRFGAIYSSNTCQLTTENASEVPNGDFEELTNTINMTINQGGRWSIATAIWTTFYQITLSMYISEPSYWASINQKTCNINAVNKNSWYMIPSTYNTTLSWISHQPEAKIWGIGQNAYDSTADIYKNNVANSGNNAMVIRNVAWDLNGPSIADNKQTGNTDFSNYYCKNAPSSIANRSVGKLFLGSYVYDNGIESYNEGVAFTSRPCYLNGFYKYFNDSQDIEEKGTISIQLLNEETVIASGKLELVAVNEYTKFSVPLNYEQYNLKATNLRIMISSSNRSDEVNIKTTNYINKDECCSRGATFVIDNLTFSYEL